MVRSLVCPLKILSACLAVAALLLAASATQAHALSVYEDGGIGSTYTTYFEDVLDGYFLPQDYVYFRSGQYQYTLVVGDLEYENLTFTGSMYDYYTITTSNNYGSGYLSLIHSTGTDLNLDVSDHLVYSNLGYYPSFYDRGEYYGLAVALILLVFGCCCLLRPLFGFTYRIRANYR